VALSASDFYLPNTLVMLDAATGRERPVARPALPPDFPGRRLPLAQVVRWPSSDGLEIEGILVYPLGYVPGRRCPLIVNLHGGPTGVFVRNYLAEPYSDGQCDLLGLAAAGFAVLRPNPRGSGGYGEPFRLAGAADWGGGDYQDVIAGVDALVERGIADPARLGIMGWSYGGYLAAWAITQSRRFRAACVGAALVNLISQAGSSDLAGFIQDAMGAEVWQDPERYQRRSPLFQLGRLTTPTLIQHGAEDTRVPAGQARELYNALRRQGTPAELVLYPRQGHLVGEPRLLMDVQRRAREWMIRWLA
jgi:dipeptidyl aminopeptidase/acylaminoacyl peptidase